MYVTLCPVSIVKAILANVLVCTTMMRLDIKRFSSSVQFHNVFEQVTNVQLRKVISVNRTTSWRSQSIQKPNTCVFKYMDGRQDTRFNQILS